MNLRSYWHDQGGEADLQLRDRCVMGRAIAILAGSAAESRPFNIIGQAIVRFWRELTRDAVRPYRPELHYMRGPGPAWRAKHGIQ